MADLDLVPFTTGRLLWAVADGSDPDNEPDLIPCDGGTIKLTPIVPNAKTVNSTDPALVAFGPINLTLDPAGTGYGLWNGSNQLLLDDMGDGSTNPTVAAGAYTHRVDFLNITAQGTTVKFPTINVRISADTATDPAHPDIPMLPADGGVCNLAVLSPITATGITPITQGAPGLGIVSIAVDTSNLVTTMTDGSTLTAPVEAAFTAGLSTAVSDAQDSATAAATSETNAADSATAAAGSASDAATSAANAAASASTATDAFKAHIKGAWSASTAYAVDDLATDNGSTYRRLVAGTTATAPGSDATNWAVFARAGVDGTGSVSKVAGKSPDVSGNVALVASDVGARPDTWTPTAAEVGALPAGEVVPDADLPARLSASALSAAFVAQSAVGAASGIAPLDSGSKVPASYLPSYVDDVLDFANLAAFPTTGEAGKIYIADDTNKEYRWNTGSSTYIEIAKSPGSTDSLAEGSVNLYYTNARASAAAPVQSVAGQTGAVTAATLKTQLGAGSASGLATLGADGKVPAAQLPTSTSGSAPLVRGTVTSNGSSAVLPTTRGLIWAAGSGPDVTFTAPASGKVRVAIEAVLNTTSGTAYGHVCVWDKTAGAIVAGTERLAMYAPSGAYSHVRFEIPISGLTPGASYSYSVGGRASAANAIFAYYGGIDNAGTNYGPAILEVWAE